MRRTGFMNGVLSYHLGRLERRNLIVAKRGPRTSRFYSRDIPESDFAMIKALRRPTPRSVLLALLHSGELSFAQLVERSKRSPSTTSLYLTQLVKDGIVAVRMVNLRKFYRLTDREGIDRLLEDHGPGILDRYASNFEDMINPLRF